MSQELPRPIGDFRGIMAGLKRLERRITAANRVIAAAREVNERRMDVDGATYVGLTEHVEALDEALATFDREQERSRDPGRLEVPDHAGRT